MGDLISADYGQLAQMRDGSADLNFPYIPNKGRKSSGLRNALNAIHNESPRSISRSPSPNSEANLFDPRRVPSFHQVANGVHDDYLLLPDPSNVQTETDHSRVSRHVTPSLYRRMSLLMHIWFRIPYDKHFRITVCILSIAIALQCISLSPNVLSEDWRIVAFLSTFLNVILLSRITWSSSFADVWTFSSDLRNHLPFPRIFLVSYVLGVISTN